MKMELMSLMELKIIYFGILTYIMRIEHMMLKYLMEMRLGIFFDLTKAKKATMYCRCR